MITIGMWLAVAGLVAVAFESGGAALVFFGLAGLMLRLAVA